MGAAADRPTPDRGDRPVAVKNKLPEHFARRYAREIAKIEDKPGKYPLEMSNGLYADILIEQRGEDIIIKPATARDAIAIRHEDDRNKG
jgi:hypothetical protein